MTTDPQTAATTAPVKQRADCTETEWAEQERARFERLYTREYTRADTAVRDADIYQARLERLGEGYTRERKRAERAEAEAERLRTYRDATCICQHTEQQHFEDACLVCDCGDYLVPGAAREVIARWRDAATEAAEPHRLALSTALGLGTSAPWDAIRVRAAELAGQPVAVDRGADADRRLYAWAHDIDMDDGDICIPGVRSSGTGPEEVAIVVHREDMPVLAGMLAEAGDAPVDRGAVLREAADELDAHAAQLANASDDPAVFVAKARARAAIEWRVAAALLRRLAEDATPVAPSAATPNGTGAAVAASGDRPAVLTEPERQFLTLALDLAADQMASRGDEFGDEDTAALDTLRRLAAETPSDCPGYETQPNRCACPCEGCRHNCAAHQAAETPGPETQGAAHPAETYWQIETQWRSGDWHSWALRAEHDDALAEFERAKDGKSAWRLVRFHTTTAVEAEHQPDIETPDAPPVEPHPTEADLRHALAVLDRFEGRDTSAPAAFEADLASKTSPKADSKGEIPRRSRAARLLDAVTHSGPGYDLNPTAPAVVAEPGKENDRG